MEKELLQRVRALCVEVSVKTFKSRSKFQTRYVLGVGHIRDVSSYELGLFKDKERQHVPLNFPDWINSDISLKEPQYRLVLERVRSTPVRTKAKKKSTGSSDVSKNSTNFDTSKAKSAKARKERV